MLGDEGKSITFLKEAAASGSVEAMKSLHGGGDVVPKPKSSTKFVLVAASCFILLSIALIVSKKERLLGQLIGGLVGVAIGSFLGALLLQYVTLFVAKFKPTYWISYKANVVSLFFSFVLNFNFGFLMGLMNVKQNAASVLFTFFSGFVIDVIVYRYYIKDTNNLELGYGKLSIVSLLQIFSGFVLIFIIVLLFTAGAAMLKR